MFVKGFPTCLSLYPAPVFPNYLPKQLSCDNYEGNVKRFRIARSPVETLCNGETIGLRVFVLSDLHTDYYENMAWVSSLSKI